MSFRINGHVMPAVTASSKRQEAITPKQVESPQSGRSTTSKSWFVTADASGINGCGLARNLLKVRDVNWVCEKQD
jgi:hypothetical protein